MSQAYYDVEALESLLEERERDLELAARIGQTLLEKNRQLVDQVSNFAPLRGSPTNSHLKISPISIADFSKTTDSKNIKILAYTI